MSLWDSRVVHQVSGDLSELFEAALSSSTLGAVHGLAIALARGHPERSESRNDDFLSEHGSIGERFRITAVVS
jgi:hypothetical protein